MDHGLGPPEAVDPGREVTIHQQPGGKIMHSRVVRDGTPDVEASSDPEEGTEEDILTLRSTRSQGLQREIYGSVGTISFGDGEAAVKGDRVTLVGDEGTETGPETDDASLDRHTGEDPDQELEREVMPSVDEKPKLRDTGIDKADICNHSTTQDVRDADDQPDYTEKGLRRSSVSHRVPQEQSPRPGGERNGGGLRPRSSPLLNNRSYITDYFKRGLPERPKRKRMEWLKDEDDEWVMNLSKDQEEGPLVSKKCRGDEVTKEGGQQLHLAGPVDEGVETVQIGGNDEDEVWGDYRGEEEEWEEWVSEIHPDTESLLTDLTLDRGTQEEGGGSQVSLAHTRGEAFRNFRDPVILVDEDEETQDTGRVEEEGGDKADTVDDDEVLAGLLLGSNLLRRESLTQGTKVRGTQLGMAGRGQDGAVGRPLCMEEEGVDNPEGFSRTPDYASTPSSTNKRLLSGKSPSLLRSPALANVRGRHSPLAVWMMKGSVTGARGHQAMKDVSSPHSSSAAQDSPTDSDRDDHHDILEAGTGLREGGSATVDNEGGTQLWVASVKTLVDGEMKDDVPGTLPDQPSDWTGSSQTDNPVVDDIIGRDDNKTELCGGDKVNCMTVDNVRGTQPVLAGVETVTGVDRMERVPGTTTDQPPDTTTSPHPVVAGKDDSGQCSYDDNGFCEYHGVVGVKHWKPRSVWGQKKNGIFGWKAVKTWYWTCKKVTKTKGEAGPKPTFVQMRSSGEGTNGNFTGRGAMPCYGDSSGNVQADRASGARRRVCRK